MSYVKCIPKVSKCSWPEINEVKIKFSIIVFHFLFLSFHSFFLWFEWDLRRKNFLDCWFYAAVYKLNCVLNNDKEMNRRWNEYFLVNLAKSIQYCLHETAKNKIKERIIDMKQSIPKRMYTWKGIKNFIQKKSHIVDMYEYKKLTNQKILHKISYFKILGNLMTITTL